MTEKPLPRTGSSAGPLAEERDGLIKNIEQFGTNFGSEAEIINARAEALENAQEEQKKRDAANERLQRAMRNLGSEGEPEGSEATKPEEPGKNYPLQSPAITVNMVLGLVLAGATLIDIHLTGEQISALTVIVSALLLIVPIIAGFIIKAINSREA